MRNSAIPRRWRCAFPVQWRNLHNLDLYLGTTPCGELFVREDADMNPEMGTALADISRLFVTPVSDSLYKLQAENNDGDRTELYISPRALY